MKITKVQRETTKVWFMGTITGERRFILLQALPVKIDFFAYIDFIKQLMMRMGKDLAIFMDNAGSCTAGECEAFYEKRKLRII
jgi:hypothetical protein